jgi:hypothetical protein
MKRTKLQQIDFVFPEPVTANQLSLFNSSVMPKQNAPVQVLSPDGFTIDFEINEYPNMDAAIAAFEQWKKRYERQGYYSSNFARIPLDELKDHCQFITL